jgi:hypothetical protein
MFYHPLMTLIDILFELNAKTRLIRIKIVAVVIILQYNRTLLVITNKLERV